jgi:hypothetical protein
MKQSQKAFATHILVLAMHCVLLWLLIANVEVTTS